MEIAPLLLFRAVHVKDLAVAGIRRLAAEADRPERAPPDDLVHESETHDADPHAARLLGHVRRPEPELFHLRLNRAQDRVRNAGEERGLGPVVQVLFSRVDVAIHDAGGELPDLLLLGCRAEVDHDGRSPLADRHALPQVTSAEGTLPEQLSTSSRRLSHGATRQRAPTSFR
jgi:hypothetical protein